MIKFGVIRKYISTNQPPGILFCHTSLFGMRKKWFIQRVISNDFGLRHSRQDYAMHTVLFRRTTESTSSRLDA